MGETLKIIAKGATYEEAVQETMAKLLEACGNSEMKVFRRAIDLDAVEFRDWVINEVTAQVTSAGQIQVECEFYLYGSMLDD